MSELGILVVAGWKKYAGETGWNKGRIWRYGNAQSPSYLCRTPRDAGCGARIIYPFLIPMLSNVRSINNKTYVLQNYLLEQNVDLPSMIETWVREGKIATLNQPLPTFFGFLTSLD